MRHSYHLSGLSSKSANSLINKKKFTSQELEDDFDLNWYQLRFRNMDPQIGRFLQIDPLAFNYVHNSTYAYAENDVIRAIDLEGLEKLVVTYDNVTSNISKITIEAMERNGVAADNKITFTKGDLKESGYKITKDVFRVQNDISINGHKLDVSQDKELEPWERFVAENGETQSDDKVPGITIKENNEIVGEGQDFVQAGDIYHKSEGYASASTRVAANGSMAGVSVLNQAKTLGNTVKGLDMKNVLIRITGNKANLKELNAVRDYLRKNGFKDAIIDVGTNAKLKHDQTKFEYNATIVAVNNSGR